MESHRRGYEKRKFIEDTSRLPCDMACLSSEVFLRQPADQQGRGRAFLLKK